MTIAPPAEATRRGHGDGRGRSALPAVAYVLHLLTGLLVYLMVDKEDAFARWHALQAIGIGLPATVIGLGLGYFGGPGSPAIGAAAALWWLLVYILLVVLAVKAYQGQKFRVPVIADFADKRA